MADVEPIAESPTTLDKLPAELLEMIADALLDSELAAVAYLSAVSALSSSCTQLRECLQPLRAKFLDLNRRLGNVTLAADGAWIHQHIPAAAGDISSWQRQLAASSGKMHVTSCVNVIGREGFEPKTLLFWHCKSLQPAECRVAAALLMSAPAFHCIHLSQNAQMGDAGLLLLLPAIARQLTSDRRAGPKRALLHWSTAEQARIGDRLAALKVIGCGLGDEGVCALARLIENLVTDAESVGGRLTLTELSLAGNPAVGQRGRAALDALRLRCPGLEVKL